MMGIARSAALALMRRAAYERPILRLLPEMRNDRKAVQAWHEQVQQDDVGSLASDRLQGLLAVRCGHYLIRLAFEELAHQVDDLRVIVDDQEAAALRRDMGQ